VEKGATVPIYNIYDMKFYHCYGGKTFLLHWNRSPGTSTTKPRPPPPKTKNTEIKLGEEQHAFHWKRSMTDLTF